jgi:hypothetical protein
MRLISKILLSSIIILGFGLISTSAKAQVKPKILQFSGIITGEEGNTGLPGVNIYIPKRGVGTNSDIYGFFTMPVMEGDSIIFSMVGYIRQYYKIAPIDNEDRISVIIELKQDTTQLSNIDIFPFGTERQFKDAILAMRAPKDLTDNIFARSLDPEAYEEYLRNAPMSPQANYRHFLNQQYQMIQDRSGPRSIPLLNPFAWQEFIRSLKKKDN